MKKLPITLFISTLSLLGIACDEIKTSDNSQITSELVVAIQVKTPSEILIGGSWNNPNAIMSEDVVFNEDGTMLWRSGTDEGEDTWEVKGTDILHFYGQDYKIEELTESKLVVSLDSKKITYERNNETGCNPQFKVEGINDAKGTYFIGKESWTIHFAEEGFVAFHTKNEIQDDAIDIKEIMQLSNCKFSIIMEGIQGEIVPRWTLVYNEGEKFYDLHVHSYDAGTDTWSDKIYAGSNNNG